MPPQEAGEVRAFFDSVAQCVSAEASSYVPYSAPVLDRQLSILSQAVRQTIRKWAIPKQSILDVGCGHGAMLAPLVDDYEITGIDFALAMLPVALQRGYAVCQGDARDLPFENEQFDIVVCAEAIQQFEDITAFVSEMARVCKWGGSVIVTTLNRTSLLRMALRFVSPALRATAFSVPVIRRRPADIIDLAAGAALTLGDIAWVLSPTQLVVYDARPTSLLGPFATNFILLLHKAYSPS
jgi:SAM-dependent methyltransferase